MGIGSSIAAQDQMVNALIHTAGLPPEALRARDPNWSLVWKAGLYEIGRQCDQYLDALFRFNREQHALHQDLAAAAGATGAIMGLAGASAKAIAITAAAFGLSNALFEAHVNSILFTIEPSALRNVAQQGLQNYLKRIDEAKIVSRPDTLIALQGYLTQCSPAAIEANINNAASGAPSVVSSNPEVAEKAAALAAPGSTTLAPPPPPITRPTDERPAADPKDPYATLTNEDFYKLRFLFGLGRFKATNTNSQKFKDKVKSFQQCLGSKNQAGFLTQSQLKIALEGDPKCVPTPPPSPPSIKRPIDILPPSPDDPYVRLTDEEFNKLRVLLGLGQREATVPNSKKFKDKVKSFQQCLGKTPVGVLTKSQLKSALEDPKCMPTTPATPPASQPAGSPAPQPAAPSAPQPQPGGVQQPPPPPISR